MIGWLMNVQQLVEWELVGETWVLGENPPQSQFAHKFHVTWAGAKPGPLSWEAGDCLSYGTATRSTKSIHKNR
jgi:hypothetical protein